MVILDTSCGYSFSFNVMITGQIGNGYKISTSSKSSVVLGMNSNLASDLLYQDQQAAMERRSLEEEKLLGTNKKIKELLAPKLKAKPPKSGTGFGAGAINSKAMDPMTRLAVEQAKIVKRDGVLRINNVLSPELSDELREYVLDQQKIAEIKTRENPSISKAFYGVENARKNRCDLQLSLLRGGFAADQNAKVDVEKTGSSHPLLNALQALLGSNGSLHACYENLVTNQGEFYELAAVITDPGSNRQQVHPDLPFQKDCPLYVIFLALQDVNEDMGPTTFLLKTNSQKENERFFNHSEKDEQLSTADCRLSTLKKGEAVLFDARVLHCGNANHPEKGSTRVLFNFSFRNPQVTKDLGYAGSIRPGYVSAMTLEDLSKKLDSYSKGDDPEPFAEYGDGLQVRWR